MPPYHVEKHIGVYLGNKGQCGGPAWDDWQPWRVCQPCRHNCGQVARLEVASKKFLEIPGLVLAFIWFSSGMSHLRSPSQKMRRVTRGFQEKEIFGEPSWGPHPPNTTSQSDKCLWSSFDLGSNKSLHVKHSHFTLDHPCLPDIVFYQNKQFSGNVSFNGLNLQCWLCYKVFIV